MGIRQTAKAVTCSLALVVSFFFADNEATKLSEEGLANIIDCEGCQRNDYVDQAGVRTVGVGSTSNVSPNTTISNSQVAVRLRKDTQVAEQCLARKVKVPLSQGEYDAYASFIINVGCYGFSTSTSYVILSEGGDRRKACYSMRRWNKITVNGKKVYNQGLANRREKDIKLCIKQL
ncbi:MAG: hypothetical protein [Caudoviricetes sp.]|nr:MAG: hypothetical protein [Caudoviricetes sp.]